MGWKREFLPVTLADAQSKVCKVRDKVYHPIPENQSSYARLYALYRQAHDAFGGIDDNANLGNVMKDLIALRQEARQG